MVKPPLNILYVDDDADIRTIVGLSLGLDPTLTTVVLSSGAEALSLLRKQDWMPDIILLDVMMPFMDGRTVFAEIRRLPGCSSLPIIFITARVGSRETAELKELGAAGTLAKPFNPVELAGQIREFMAR